MVTFMRIYGNIKKLVHDCFGARRSQKKFSGEGLKLYGFKTTFPWGDTAHRRRE